MVIVPAITGKLNELSRRQGIRAVLPAARCSNTNNVFTFRNYGTMLQYNL
jgi:hypothetical protein